jgi:alcohol dehydrogenase
MPDGVSSFTETYGIESPDRIEYGIGATERLTAFADEGDVESALVVTDSHLREAGVIDAPVEALEAAGVGVDVYDGVEPEPKLRMPEEAADRLRGDGHDLVVGVGGGSSMDTAKVASVLAERDVAVREMLGMGNVPGDGRPLALLPTTAGTGSEVTHIGVFADEEDDGNKKVIYSRHLFSDLSIVDPGLTETLPPAVAAATGMDALTHAIEAYTTTLRTPYTDMLARRAIELVGENLREAVHQGAENDRARYEMSLAAMIAGQAFVNSGLGAVHALTYPVGMEFDLGHGLANAVLLPAVMKYNVPAEPERFADVARLLGESEREGESTLDLARRSVDAVADLNDDIGVPNDIATFGDLDADDFGRFADVCFEHSQHNIDRNPRTLDRDDVVEMFEMAYEGVESGHKG